MPVSCNSLERWPKEKSPFSSIHTFYSCILKISLLSPLLQVFQYVYCLLIPYKHFFILASTKIKVLRGNPF